MPVERTLVIIKPDGVMKGIIDEIKERYTNAGLQILHEKRIHMFEDQAASLYDEHKGKFFFEGLVLAMISGPSVALLIEGENAIEAVRELNGATDPSKANKGTIRRDFLSSGGPFNVVHGSESLKAVVLEIAALELGWESLIL